MYLSDVLDHISTIVEDMETLAVDARDLIDLVFNTIAHQNNNSMQMLAVVSTIFLPITFIAGVSVTLGGNTHDGWDVVVVCATKGHSIHASFDKTIHVKMVACTTATVTDTADVSS